MKFRALNFDYHADAVVRVLEDVEASDQSQRRSSIVRLLPVAVVTSKNNSNTTKKAAVDVDAAVDAFSTADNNNKESTTSALLPLPAPAAECSSPASKMNGSGDQHDHDDDFRDNDNIMMRKVNESSESFVEDDVDAKSIMENDPMNGAMLPQAIDMVCLSRVLFFVTHDDRANAVFFPHNFYWTLFVA
jgi:hypothetical protein